MAPRRTTTHSRMGGHDYGWEYGTPGVMIAERWEPLCDAFIDLDDPWAGTYCKLPNGHDGQHSAHYPPAPALPKDQRCICDPDADGTSARGCPVHWPTTETRFNGDPNRRKPALPGQGHSWS